MNVVFVGVVSFLVGVALVAYIWLRVAEVMEAPPSHKEAQEAACIAIREEVYSDHATRALVWLRAWETVLDRRIARKQ